MSSGSSSEVNVFPDEDGDDRESATRFTIREHDVSDKIILNKIILSMMLSSLILLKLKNKVIIYNKHVNY